jgi:hypothetical protein
LIEICIDVVSDKINHDFLNQINIDSTTHLSTNCGQITAINTALENPLSAIYPNPAHDIVTVALLDKAVVIVVDAMGREVYRADALAGDLTIDLQAFVPGVYAVVVRSATGQESYSLLIQ